MFTEKSEPVQFKPILLKGLLYLSHFFMVLQKNKVSFLSVI